MAMEVVTSIAQWFVDNIYKPLRTSTDPAKGISDMFAAVDDYFRSGQRVCLVGAVALGASRDLFDDKVKTYFAGWIDALPPAFRPLGDHRTPPRQKPQHTLSDNFAP